MAAPSDKVLQGAISARCEEEELSSQGLGFRVLGLRVFRVCSGCLGGSLEGACALRRKGSW